MTTRVHGRLPDVGVEAVEAQVVALFDEYADSKVRDFVPIMVEREAVARLMPRSVVTTTDSADLA